MLNIKEKYKNMPICHAHDIIRDLACEIKYIGETLQYDRSAIDEQISKLIGCTEKILEIANYATDRGQRMEDRLKEYRSKIEKLGFKRIKNLILLKG